MHLVGTNFSAISKFNIRAVTIFSENWAKVLIIIFFLNSELANKSVLKVVTFIILL